jgi:hypothetical protein
MDGEDGGGEMDGWKKGGSRGIIYLRGGSF